MNIRLKRHSVVITLVLLFFLYGGMKAQHDFSVLSYWDYYSDAENTLYKMQCDLSFSYLETRKNEINKLKTIDDWKNRQALVKEKLYKIIGPFPEKTPLNPVITGKLKGDGFLVEKLYFESMPGVKVTAAFFIPEGKRWNLPTIIYCSGHSDLAFRSTTYQHVIINLVKKGFAVFAFDPFGQGERQQYFDEAEGKSKFSATHEHSYPGAQLFINGASVARYMIWDGTRSVDYLLSRKEVDPTRIGITGRSGGGTQTAYIAAMEDRIKVAAPECYITTFEYLLKSMGPQDAEQNFYHGLKEKIDLADLLEVRAPKPNLMITTTRDIFSIQGARETFQEVNKVYEAYGFMDKMQMVEDDAGHESTLKNREAMYAFFQTYLENPGDNKDLETTPFLVEELYVTPTGQLSSSFGSRFLYDINKSVSKENTDHLESYRRDIDNHLENIKIQVKSISGYDAIASKGELVFSGRTDFETYYLEKYLIEYVSGIVYPFVILRPKISAEKVVIYLDDLKDKKSEQAHKIPLDLVLNGFSVIIPDLPGYGDLGPGYLTGDAYFSPTSYNQWFAGILNDKSTMAIHAETIEAIVNTCFDHLGMKDLKLIGISKGGFNSSLLHASVIGVDFDGLVLVDPILSLASIVSNKDYEPSFIPFAVAGALQHYDLPDLAAAFAPNPLIISNALDYHGQPAEVSEIQHIYEFVEELYKSLGATENFFIDGQLSNQELIEFLNNL